MFLDPNFIKSILKQFQIVNKLVIVLSFPVYLRQLDLPWMDHIDKLAINGTRTQLLNLR